MRAFKDVVVEAAARVRRFLADDAGATAIEYSLLASGIGLAVIATVSAVGTSIKEVLYDKIADALSGMSK
jgi:pilus assembly protein Flp/PilA